MISPKGLTVLSVLALATLVRAEENRFNLVDQQEFWVNRGFSLTLESNVGKDGLLPTSAIKLRLKVGDGKSVRTIEAPGPLPVNSTVNVSVAISSSKATLVVDGKSISSDGGFVASSSSQASAGDTYVWARSRTAYRVQQGDYNFNGATGSAASPLPWQLQLFDFSQGVTFDQKVESTVSFKTSFKIVPITADMMKGAVDKYGQAAAADWPEKVKSDADLTKSAEEEKSRSKDWKRPADWDKFGGLKGVWTDKATGFFRVTKHEGVWWLISPEGNPVFYTGLCTAPATLWETTPVTGREAIFLDLPPKDGPTTKLWQRKDPWSGEAKDSLALHSWNLYRKFGADFEQKSVEETGQRLQQWGFTGVGKWADDIPDLPRVVTLNLADVPKLTRHLDVFDPAACEKAKAHLAETVTPLVNDPYVLGFSIGNEYEEVILTSEIKEILEKHKDSATAIAVRKAVKLSSPPTDAEIEQARQFYAKAYYSYLYKTMKAMAPNHLYFGYWTSVGWWQNEADWDMVVPYCDVLGYDLYSPHYGGRDGQSKKLIDKFDKPTLLGEFGNPPNYGGTRGYSWYQTVEKDDAAAGARYAEFIRDAAADPRCVGTMYFQYRDQPITGRGPGRDVDLVQGEAYAFGFVDITDRPKWDIILPARDANLAAAKTRLKLKG